MKIHNDEDKTIFEVRVEKTEKPKKLKPSVVICIILLVLAALAGSIYAGYLLHLVTK